MRISDWSSDVCSSDLRHPAQPGRRGLKTGVMSKPIRIGQIVPSSNVTMETEIPALLRAREQVAPERFTFHSSRMRMKKVTADELAAMDRDQIGRAHVRTPLTNANPVCRLLLEIKKKH